MLSDEEDNLIDFLEEKYACHTVILYGSRALGAAHETSDWDVLGLSQLAGERLHFGMVDGVGEVNAYVYASSMATFNSAQPSPLFRPIDHIIRLRHGRVLVQEDGAGDKLVAFAQDVYQRGVPRPSKIQLVKTRRFFLVVRMGILRDETLPLTLRHYVRHEILNQAFGAYFTLRGAWTPSPKEGLAFWAARDKMADTLFTQAVAPDAPLDAIEAFLLHVLAVEADG